MKKVFCIILISILMFSYSNVNAEINKNNTTIPLGPDEDGFWTSGMYDMEMPSKERIKKYVII